MSTTAAQSSAVHPIFDGFCRAFSGDTTRAAANTPAKLHPFWVQYVRGGVIEAQFEAMAEDSIACVMQHMGAANGAAVKVMSLDAWHAKCAAEARARHEAEHEAAMAKEGDLSAADLAEIDAAMHADKQRNGYDQRRVDAAWQAERRQDQIEGRA